MPALKGSKERKHYRNQLKNIKYSSKIFSALLKTQRILDHNPEGLGILLGDSKAANRIIKVCNPCCSPCTKAYKHIEELLLQDTENFQVQIIFTATNNENDQRADPVRYFLTINDRNDRNHLHNILNKWYNSEKKGYKEFLNKYPIDIESKSQDDRIFAMQTWCEEVNIMFIPTYFI